MKKNNLSNILLVFLLIIYGLAQGFAQDVQIETTNLSIIDKKLEISYEYAKSKKKHRFDVWVEITSSLGKKIIARALTGDIGDNLAGGKDKKIIWDYNADGIVLNEEVNIVVKAIVSTVVGAVNTGKMLFQSGIMPGWGISSIKSDKPYWLLGIAGYAALGSSLYLNSSYKSTYDSYIDSNNETERADLLSKSRSQQSLSKVFAFSAIGIWCTGIVWTAIKANKNNSTLSVFNKNQKIQFYSFYKPGLNAKGFTLKYAF